MVMLLRLTHRKCHNHFASEILGDAGELFQSSDDLIGSFTQGVALGWNLLTPSALVNQLYSWLCEPWVKMIKAAALNPGKTMGAKPFR